MTDLFPSPQPEEPEIPWAERLATGGEDPASDFEDDDEMADELDARFDAGQRHLYSSIVRRHA